MTDLTPPIAPASVELTVSARAKIQDLLAEENNPNLKLRLFVQGGGCSGFQYGFTFDEVVDEDDFEIPFEGGSLLVDGMSLQYVHGASVDYVEELMGASFHVRNPNATTTCGCGSSFAL
jgi:iron-sulfur cluster insertion protein